MEIESAVARLSTDKLLQFRQWFAQFEADQWDRQIEADVAQGRLDRLANEAIRQFQAGRCREPNTTYF
jgi:hypothetical protein